MNETLSVSVEGSGGVPTASDPNTVTALVLLWAREEPGRVGEVAQIPGGFPGMSALLGRGDASAKASSDRVELVRQRPGSVEPTGPLRSARVSRDQLRVLALSGGRVRVENVGRAALLHNGELVSSAEVSVGDLLEIQKQVLFLCAHRPLVLPAFAPGAAPPALHAFGTADAWGIVGESPAVWALRERVAFMAGRAAHVLICGPSGTGKELVAQAIHKSSPRARRPLVSRNAATIPEALIDAELFGNARNYPNPGMAERPGLIGEADGGTLFLDEFAEIPPAMQAHLLRVLDAGEYHRLGESRPRKADFRLIAATNRPESALKEDVLARLRIRVEVPDLNGRREDIPLLAVHLLRKIAKDDPDLAWRYFPDGDPRGMPRITGALVEALVRRTYTTHVRELEALLWQAMASGRGDTLDRWEGMEAVAAPSPRSTVTEAPGRDPLSIPAAEIQACLDKYNGRQEPAWRELGLSSRHVLTRLVRRYGLSVRGRSPETGGATEELDEE